jgi:acyl-CoA synthetase
VNTVLTLHDPELAAGYKKAGVWRDETLFGLLVKHATEQPDRYALRDGYRRLTWRQLLAWVDSVADDLDEGGVRRGQRVCVWLPNRVEAVVVFLACSRNGYVCNPSLHQNYTVAEIVELLERVQCAALFAQTGYGADADSADVFTVARNMPSMKRLYRLEPYGGRWCGANHPFPATEPRRPVQAEPVTNADKVTYLAFTSGTTGAPKGVMHSDNTLLANGRSLVEDWHHGPDTVLLSLSPMSHHIGTVALEQMLVAGCELIVNDPPPGMLPLDWILETGATYIMGVPTHAMDILAEMRRQGLSRLGAVTIFYMAGAPIPQETAKSFLAVGITPQNIYGMTENGSHQYTLPDDDVNTITATCGRSCRGYEVRIWKQDAPDVEAGLGEIGEIGGRGGVLMLGYFANQAATEVSFNRFGWFMSGDLGRFDANGNLEIVGRKKDLIIRGGHNIHPCRIEDLALKHPAVLLAAAIPVADARLGEKVCLVLSVDGAAPSSEDILTHLHRAGLSKYDMPEYVAIVTEFPMTSSGKVLKRGLIEWVKTGKISPEPVRWNARMFSKETQ